MISRGWVYVFYMVLFVGGNYMIDLFLGNVYARYVLAYTGTVFMVGMLLGQKSERAWINQLDNWSRVTPELGKKAHRRSG